MNTSFLSHPLFGLAQAFAPADQGQSARALRASINLGNPVLAGRDDAGAPKGVSVDLARELGRRLQLDVELVVFDNASASVDAVAQARADIGFFAIDPKRGESIAFTDAYVHIEGCYAVRADSPIVDNDAVDRPDHRIVVGTGSAYDLYLSRNIRQARIERVEGSSAVLEHFLNAGCEVAAGVRQQLESDLQARAGQAPALRLLPGRFMVIRQAMGCARVRGPLVANALAAFVEDVKASGFVADALQRHGQSGASVAPAAPAHPPATAGA